MKKITGNTDDKQTKTPPQAGILRAAKYSDLRPAKVGLKRGFEHPELKPEDDRPETD
jgi:hypothetical protein